MTNGGGQPPTLGGFITFITNVMAIPSDALDPNTNPVVGWAYDFAVNWVNDQLCLVPSQSGSWTIYAMAIYNLAADTLINWVQDASDAPVFKNTPNGQGLQYWSWLRATYGVNNFVAGVVQSTSDVSTWASYMIPETFKGYTIANLGNLKTPYGVRYLGIATSLGTLWGLT
jgi:hypothetical protein